MKEMRYFGWKELGLISMMALAFFSSCKKEIDFDYHEVAPLVMIEGRVTNEGSEVLITKTRNVTDSVKNPCLTGAEVQIQGEGVTVTLPYDAAARRYRSSFCGKPGQTYRLSINFEGRHYEATSTMPSPAPVKSTEFIWQSILNERLVMFEMWAVDPEPDVRNYYWYRMDRISRHPHFDKKPITDAYRWNVFDDRGCPPGLIFRDITCMSERAAEEDEEENWKSILYEGDTLTFQLMTIDLPTYDFFRSLRSGQSGGANPIGNIVSSAVGTAGASSSASSSVESCLGYFTATSITRSDTIVFHFSDVKER
jgi:hypothetical protein